MRAPLSPVEQDVYHFLLDFLSEHTFQPSVREIAKQLKIPSTKSVTDLLASLERKGYIEREPGRSRGVMIVGFAGGPNCLPVPLMELDGTSLRAVDHITLDRRLVPADESFLVRVTHEAAPSHAVRIGDVALVDPSSRAKDGDVVVVRTAGVILIRAMERRGAILYLHAPGTGSALELGQGDDYAVLGTLAGLFSAWQMGEH